MKKFLKNKVAPFLVGAVLATPLVLIEQGESQDARPVVVTKITGNDELLDADVVLKNGRNALVTDATVLVEATLGLEPVGSTWFFFGPDLQSADGIGAVGDTVRIQIPAAENPIGITLYPAVDYTYTVTAADIANDAPERAVAENFCLGLEADTNFITANWKCELPKDHSYVHIASRLFNEWGTRDTWSVTCSGTTECNIAFTDIARRNKASELRRSPNDPARLGVLNISGTVLAIPGGLGQRFFEFFQNTETTPSSDLRQNCSGGSFSNQKCDFFVPLDNDEDIFVSQIRCFGGCNGLKFGQFLCKNSDISNGIEITIRSDGEENILPLIVSTEDFKNKFSFPLPGDAFRIDIQSGGDQFVASFAPELAFVLRKSGTFGPGNDDFIRIRLQDRLDGSQGGNLDEFQCLAEGFRQEA